MKKLILLISVMFSALISLVSATDTPNDLFIFNNITFLTEVLTGTNVLSFTGEYTNKSNPDGIYITLAGNSGMNCTGCFPYLLGSQDFTVCVKTTEDDPFEAGYLMSQDNPDNGAKFLWGNDYDQTSTDMRYLIDTWQTPFAHGKSLDEVYWQCLKVNDTGYYTYINGTEIGGIVSAESLHATGLIAFFGDILNELNGFGGTAIRLCMWDHALEDITDYAPENLDVVCAATPPPPGLSPPTFVFPTPNSGTSNSTNQTINMSCGDDVNINYTLWFDINENPINPVLDNTTYGNWTMNISTDTIYFYKGQCHNSSSGVSSANSSLRNFTLDTTTPTLTINTNNFFNATNNMSTSNQYLNNITLNASATDNDNIFAFLYNITKDGVVYFNYSNTSINEKSHNFTRVLDISSWPSGVYDIEIAVADGHHYIGGYQIRDYKITQKGNKVTFKTTEGNVISISSDGAISTSYTKEKNSYSYGFGYTLASATRTVYVEADNKIYYLPKSSYNLHFVVWNGRHGNWIDFEGVIGTYKVDKINDYKYKITFSNLALGNELISKSIGGLNVVTRNYQWYRGTYAITAPTTSSIAKTDLTLNITKDDLFITNVSVAVSYNGTFKTPSKRDYGSHIIYNVTVTAPLVTSNSNIPYFWNVTINQSNDGIYNFLLEGNNSVLYWGIDDCTNATVPTLNISFRNISTDDYVDVNLEYVFHYWLSTQSQVFNFSGNLTGNNETFCKYSNETSIISNIFFEYNIVGGSILFDYSVYQMNLTNVTQVLTLYTQEGTTQVLFTVLDIDSNPIVDAYIHILRYDVATNTYQTTEVLRTDSQGQTLGNIILGTAFYNFFIYYQGNLVYIEQAVKLITTTRTFRVNLAGTDWFDDFETTLGVNTFLYFNNATNNFVYTWTDPSSSMHQACLRVDEMNRTGKFELNTTCVTSTSGTILYNIPVLNAGSTYMGTGYLKFDFPMITDVVNWLVSPSSSFFNVSPLMGLFVALLFCISMVMIGLPQPSLSLTFLGIGVLICSLLGLWAISIMQVTSIIFLMIIQLYIRKGKVT